MKALYRAVASVSMILLSTAAALAVRRIAMGAKKRKQEREHAEVTLNKAKNNDKEQDLNTEEESEV